jgi:hypothetical protein
MTVDPYAENHDPISQPPSEPTPIDFGIGWTIAGFSLIALGGPIFLGWDIFQWLRTGTWNALDGWWFLMRNPQLISDWLLVPQSWLGLHKLVAGFLDWPLFLSLPTVGALLIGLGITLSERLERRETKRRNAAAEAELMARVKAGN